MNSKEFLYFPKKPNKTQGEMAQLLVTNIIKADRSYEQGWRSVPAHVERQIFFLVSRKRDAAKRQKPCWITKKCPPEHRKKMPGMGIPSRAFVLVCLWKHSGRDNPKGLEQEDENVQELQGASAIAGSRARR